MANFYYAAIQSGFWKKIRAALVEQVQTDTERSADLNYAIIDSQSGKITSGAEERRIDGGKTKGRKRHIVVDTIGNLLAVAVYVANMHNTKSGILAARDAFEKYPSITFLIEGESYGK